MSLIPGATGVASQFPDGFLLGAGTVGAPSYRLGDASTGFYSPGTNQWALSSAGVQTLLVSSAGVFTIGPVAANQHIVNGGVTPFKLVPNSGTVSGIAFSNSGGTVQAIVEAGSGALFRVTDSTRTPTYFNVDLNGAMQAGLTSGSPQTHTFYGSDLILDTTGNTGTNSQTSFAFKPKGNERHVFLTTIQTDSGTQPTTVFDSRMGSAAVVTRPLFRFQNFGTSVANCTAAGTWTLGNTAKIGSNDYAGQLLVGRTDAAAIASGYVGETLISTYTSPTAYSATGVWNADASLTLTPGVWLLFGAVQHQSNGATIQATMMAITTSATAAVALNESNLCETAVPTGTYNLTGSVSGLYVSVSTNTTYYLNRRAFYTSGSPRHTGSIRAVRIA